MTTPELPTVLINGRRYVLETVDIDKLEQWRKRHQLQPAARLGSGFAWPPAVRYEKET